jgi:hypothetical protein
LNITNPAQFTTTNFANAAAFTFSVTGNAGGDVFLTVAPVPEPATVLGVAAAALGLGGFVRRRLRKPADPTAVA